MSRTLTTPTRSGFCAWIARRWELLCVTATLRAAERDRVILAFDAAHIPKRLKRLDLDIEALRVRKANLQD